MPRQTLIQVRRDSAADWTSANPILAEGEPGYETDTNKFKWGDGSTAWNDLDYIAGESGGKQISYTEFTSDVSITATTEGSANTVVTAPAFVADGVSEYLIEFFTQSLIPSNGAIGRNITIHLFQDGSPLGRMGVVQTPAAAFLTTPAFLVRRLIPSSGSHIYSIRAIVNAGTGTVSAGSGGSGNAVPGFIRITKVSNNDDVDIANDGWVSDTGNTWTYTSGSGGGTATFTVSGDATTKFEKGVRIRLKQGGSFKYFVVINSVHSAGTTTVTITAGSDYTLANSTITDNYFSRSICPQGYPDWFNFTPSPTGFSSGPTVTTARFSVHGRRCRVYCDWSGTSNATTMTCTAPIPNANFVTYFSGRVGNNGATVWGAHFISASSTTVTFSGLDGAAFTASGTKNFRDSFEYEF